MRLHVCCLYGLNSAIMYLNKNKNNIIALVQLFIVADITFYSPFKGSPTLDLNYQNYQVFMIVCILPQEK